MLAAQKTLEKERGGVQSAFSEMPEQKKRPRGFKPQGKEKGLFRYQEDEK